VTSTSVILVVAAILLVSTVIPGIRLYWPQRRDPVSRTDLGVALMTGALIAFAVLALQILVELRAQNDATQRQREADRQALLLVLGRQRDISGIDLDKRDLSGAYLVGKTFHGANLAGANLKNASLEEASLIEANLVHAVLYNAHLDRADLREADLADASLAGANLNGAKLDGDRLIRVNFTDADLSNAWMRADLRGARLIRARLVGARLDPADLQGADLRGADLEDANLRRANLQGVDLSTAKNVGKALDLSGVSYDGKTDWPKDTQWNGKTLADCPKKRCILSSKHVGQLFAPLTRMRSQLTKAIDRGDCFTGWRVDDELLKVGAHTLHNRATFRITEQEHVGEKTSPRAFARTYGATTYKQIAAFKLNGSPAYAERAWYDETRPRRTEVGVYVVMPKGVGLRFVAAASTPLFTLFERDFAKLFRLVGIEQPLFPSLQEGGTGCSA
jgi:uncharacterized protein YjbI with pentapeptide repeats